MRGLRTGAGSFEAAACGVAFVDPPFGFEGGEGLGRAECVVCCVGRVGEPFGNVEADAAGADHGDAFSGLAAACQQFGVVDDFCMQVHYQKKLALLLSLFQ